MAALAKAIAVTTWNTYPKFGEWLAFHEINEVDEDGELGPARYSHISGNEMESEASKLLRLCWSEGFRPSQNVLAEIIKRLTIYIRECTENTSEGKCIDLYTDPEAFLNSGCTKLTPSY